MTTNTKGTPARIDPRQVSNTIKRVLNYNDADAAKAPLGILPNGSPLPAGAFITSVVVQTVTAFNAATTNLLSVGTSTITNNVVSQTDVTLASATTTNVFRGLGNSVIGGSDTQLYAVYTQSGTAATAGQVVIVITYEGGWSN